MLKDSFSLAFNNLRQKGLRSWLTILGIFIGIAAVVSLITLGAGLQEAITGQLGTLSVDILTIQNKGAGFGPPGSTVVEKLNDNDIKILESIKGINRIIKRLIRVGSFEYNGVSNFGYLVGLPGDKDNLEFSYENMQMVAEQGRLFEPGDRGKILLGNKFLENNDFGKDFRVGKTVKINGKEFEIIGILEPLINFQMDGMVIMMFDDVEEVFNIQNEYDIIIVQVEDKNKLEEISNEIQRKLRDDRNEKIGEESFTVETPLQAFGAVTNILNIINLIVIGIAAISLFVGGIGIANTMYTSVLERRKEIGIMKAIGAQNKNILMIFLIESGLLGLVGGIAGALMGIGAAFGVSAIANQAMGSEIITASLSYPLIFGAIGFSFVVGIASGVLPAMQASRLNVVEALRG